VNAADDNQGRKTVQNNDKKINGLNTLKQLWIINGKR
jgi:hypothetical protein